MKILLVDDNRDDRKLLRYMVEKNGHVAIEAGDGSDGLEKAKSTAPDLIISDALMPVMDGFQFLREVKQDPDLRSIPFIFYSSSYKEYQDVRLAMSLGADAYVFKPVEPAELWAKIENLLKTGKREKAPPVPLIKEDAEYLKQYSQVVATKLEKKVRELELTLEDRNRA
jgi:CheY-like chemotaxis protein